MLSEALQDPALPCTVKMFAPGSSVTEAEPEPRNWIRLVKTPLRWKNTRPFKVAVTCPTSRGFAVPEPVPETPTVALMTVLPRAGEVNCSEQAPAVSTALRVPTREKSKPRVLPNRALRTINLLLSEIRGVPLPVLRSMVIYGRAGNCSQRDRGVRYEGSGVLTSPQCFLPARVCDIPERL